MARSESSVEKMELANSFKNKKVFITGHTGFKGAWLTHILKSWGASLCGYSDKPAHHDFKNFKDLLDVEVIADISNQQTLQSTLEKFQPDIIFHMAAQSLVIPSYEDPIETFMTNAMGTAHLLQSARALKKLSVFVNVTSDKCYRNLQIKKHYIESDPLGGSDPYSASKACAELIHESMVKSFFAESSTGFVTVRAGNVIGGGDWAAHRLIPDCVRAIAAGKKIMLRNPMAIRPWQHVLDALTGYLQLAQRLANDSQKYSGPWNFGPSNEKTVCVEEIVKQLYTHMNKALNYDIQPSEYKEEKLLMLDSTKSRSLLSWKTKLDVDQAVEWTADWYGQLISGEDASGLVFKQIQKYYS